ncbi:hypothetical protein QYE76_032707 [Lolium multiflorum]|uniref:Uncharacterized protein n=1 Tax=Lolium multiflorum TaxID=4521 RepID=A0AAD8VJL7_LOLMU|nr:hypothetical protein QYE76_032707 [Lolium multiflorum]
MAIVQVVKAVEGDHARFDTETEAALQAERARWDATLAEGHGGGRMANTIVTSMRSCRSLAPSVAAPRGSAASRRTNARLGDRDGQPMVPVNQARSVAIKPCDCE